MSGVLTLDELSKLYEAGEIDTVLACIVDMQGRLMGKRFHADYFINGGWEETHCCNYLLATDLEMATPDGYASSSWSTGYGDYIMKPDLSTLRNVPWWEGTALVMSDVLHGDTHQSITHSPRALLKAQIEKLMAMGFDPVMATELEFYLFESGYDALRAQGYVNMKPISGYNEDYHILQTTKEEHVMRPIRNHLFAAGIPVEGSKGEAGCGQEELNIKCGPALLTADHHTIAKHAIKEIAWKHGHSATFMAKWSHDDIGSAAHVHQSLWKDGRPAFYDENNPYGMSDVMKHYIGGMLKYASDFTYFLAPYVNSYKRFQRDSFAPTRAIWSVDNRTAGFRVCGAGTTSVRIECRIPGSDMNPYLVMAAQLAAGIKGMEEKLEPGPPVGGNTYSDSSDRIPSNLRDAREALRNSAFLKEAFGEEVITHYARAAAWELEEFDRIVTDYEIARGFEKS